MGRIGEVDHPHLADRARDEAAPRARCRATDPPTTTGPGATSPSTRSARRSRTACDDEVGSVEVGKLADLVLWDPAFFGVRPHLVIKGGMIAWAAMGDANASIPTPQPVLPRPMFGAAADAAAARPRCAWVAQAALDDGLADRLGVRRRLVAGAGRAGAVGQARHAAQRRHCRDIRSTPTRSRCRSTASVIDRAPGRAAAHGAAVLPVLMADDADEGGTRRRRGRLLLLADGRFPSGGHTQSGGVEAAEPSATSPTSSGWNGTCSAALDHGALDAAFAARRARVGSEPAARRSTPWIAEYSARTLSPYLRAVSRRQGRQLLRLARGIWPSPWLDLLAEVDGGPHQPSCWESPSPPPAATRSTRRPSRCTS